LEEHQLSVNKIFEVIVRHTCEVIPELEGHNFSRKDSLKKLGANSVDRSEIVMMTLESLSLNIALIETANAENIGELADILYEKSKTN
jgi:polyketide biosynthesis acyl carrier protein